MSKIKVLFSLSVLALGLVASTISLLEMPKSISKLSIGDFDARAQSHPIEVNGCVFACDEDCNCTGQSLADFPCDAPWQDSQSCIDTENCDDSCNLESQKDCDGEYFEC